MSFAHLVTAKLSRRNVIYFCVFVWLAIINVWILKKSKPLVKEYSLYENQRLSSGQVDDASADVTHQNPRTEFDPRSNMNVSVLMEHLNIVDRRQKDSHSTIYDKMLSKYQLPDVLAKLSFQDRCDLYFETLYSTNPTWWLNPHEELHLPHRHEFRYEDFRKKAKQEVKNAIAEEKGIAPSDVKEDKDFEAKMKLQYAVFWGKTLETEQKAVDIVTHLRTFNKCYISRDNEYEANKANKLIKQEAEIVKQRLATSEIPDVKVMEPEARSRIGSFESCVDIENRVYRWLSRSYPSYERWSGERFFKPPDMKKYVSHPEVFKPSNPKYTSYSKKTIKSRFTGNKACWMNEFKSYLNGNGIVLSIGNQHRDDMVSLIHLLRALNNKYPIQIVSYEDLEKKTKEAIVNAARNKMIDLPDSFQKVKQYFPKDYVSEKDGGLIKQEVWFVNTNNVIHESYRKKFNKFANKFLAAQFNSFSEYMLIDADTVLVQSPEMFFSLKNYVTKGAYFFKDRTAPQFRPISDGVFMQKLSPSILDNLMFDLPIITSHTTSREFFDGMGHYMESGLVMINRHMHFNSVLMMIHLNFLPLVSQRVYGDKEIFWLAFAINGDEDYHFNKYAAAAIGVETPAAERMKPEDREPEAREICAAHPGHINGEDGSSLIWFNSGFKFCGQSERVNYEEEANHKSKLKSYTTPEQLRELYENPLILKQAIIPPFKNKLETLCENIEDEPREGWKMHSKYCKSYLWCAYSRIGGLTKDDTYNTQYGQVFDFDQKSIDLFKYYGDVWVGKE